MSKPLKSTGKPVLSTDKSPVIIKTTPKEVVSSADNDAKVMKKFELDAKLQAKKKKKPKKPQKVTGYNKMRLKPRKYGPSPGFTTIPSKLYNTSKDTLLSAKLNACFQYNISRGGVDLTIEVTLQGRNSDGNLVCSVEITKHTDHRRNVSHQISVAEAKNAVWEIKDKNFVIVAAKGRIRKYANDWEDDTVDVDVPIACLGPE